MFVPEFPIDGITGAEYNPRRITPEVEETLRNSIRELGFCKPVLVQESGRLIAGHQRTNQARRLGMTHVPAFIVKNLEMAHEMTFNQLHNGADVDTVIAEVRIPPQVELGFVDIPHREIRGDFKQPGAAVRNEIYKLVVRYGSWGAVVATQSGEVLSSQQYALACKQAARPCRAFIVPDEMRERVLHYFSKEYGVFSYDRLPKNTYLQSYAQPSRGVGQNERIQSVLYDMIRPTLTKDMRLLDFGCGYGQVVRELQREGFHAIGVEFFYKGDADVIRPGVVHQMCDDLAFELEKDGLFDVVIADSVINSVDSVQAEEDVLTCVNAFCKPGGEILFSGRAAEYIEGLLKGKRAMSTKGSVRLVEFMDENGFSALPRGTKWFFQKFHTREQARRQAERYIGSEFRFRYHAAWQAHGKKVVELPLEQIEGAIRREFDLPWPDGASVGKVEPVLAAYRHAIRGLPRL